MNFSALKAMQMLKVFLVVHLHLGPEVQAAASARMAIHSQRNTRTAL